MNKIILASLLAIAGLSGCIETLPKQVSLVDLAKAPQAQLAVRDFKAQAVRDLDFAHRLEAAGKAHGMPVSITTKAVTLKTALTPAGEVVNVVSAVMVTVPQEAVQLKDESAEKLLSSIVRYTLPRPELTVDVYAIPSDFMWLSIAALRAGATLRNPRKIEIYYGGPYRMGWSSSVADVKEF